MGKRKGHNKKKAPRNRARTALRDEIRRELERSTYKRTYREVNFVSLEFISFLFKKDNPTKLRLSLQDDWENLQMDGSDLSVSVEITKIDKLEDFVLKSACKLYTLLLLLGQSQRIIAISEDEHPPTDQIFRQQNTHDVHYCTLEFLYSNSHLEDIAPKLFDMQWYIPPILSRSLTQDFPKEHFRFPFIGIPGREGGGSGGAVTRVKIANGHLRTEEPEKVQGVVLAHKEIEIRDDLKKLMREVESMRARKTHPNIVEFYASFKAGREDPWQKNSPVECLHLIFEHADGGDLRDWLNQATTPSHLKDKIKRGTEIMRGIQDLVAAVTFIHSDINKQIGYHHDIKPNNIVLFRGPPAIWKLCDFGLANLKHRDDESGTKGGQDGIGTKMYRPPESMENKSHGRAFDVYSLGCVLLELATVWEYGWDGAKLAEFRERRRDNKQRRVVGDSSEDDDSYQNNPNIVQEWIHQLRQSDLNPREGETKTPNQKQNSGIRGEERSQRCFKTLLNLIEGMMKEKAQRLLIWEVNIDLYEVMGNRTPEELKQHFRNIIQKPKTAVNGFDNIHNPLRRAKERGRDKEWQIQILINHLWSISKPEVDERVPPLPADLQKPYSTLTACPQNDEFQSHDLFGRHEIDKQLGSMFSKGNHVGLYGASGAGKSHLAYKYVNRFRNAQLPKERRHTFWLEAGTESRLRQTVLRAAECISITISESEDSLTALKIWLDEPSKGPWIMVIDGLDSLPVARLVKGILPKKTGQILITANRREILDELGIQNEFCIPVGVLELSARRDLFQAYNDDVLDTTDMDKMLKEYDLPFLLKTVANYLQKSGISTFTWFEAMKSGDIYQSLKHLLKDRLSYHRIFLPLIADASQDTRLDYFPKDPPQFREFPSAPFKLLAEMSCFNKDEIDLSLIEQNYENKTRLLEMLGFLQGCTLIGKGKGKNANRYFMHESIQEMVRMWVEQSMGPRSLLELHETALCMLLARYKSDKKKGDAPRSTYILKLRYMPHFERFLQFIKTCKKEDSFPGYECSDNMVQAAITFIHVYLDEGRCADAACILEFTRYLYTKGFKFKPQLSRHLSKTYTLSPLAREQNHVYVQAADYLKEVVNEWADQPDGLKQKWLCVLELGELYCKFMQPEKAYDVIRTLSEVNLQVDWATKEARVTRPAGFIQALWSGSDHIVQPVMNILGYEVKRRSEQRFQDQETEMEFAILKRIAEARINFTLAKLSPPLTRAGYLQKARFAFEDARLAVKSLFPRNRKWIAEVDESIADTLRTYGQTAWVTEALEIYRDLIRPLRAEIESAKRVDSQKAKWRIDCKIACAQLQLDPESKKAAIDALNILIASYESSDRLRDGNNSEDVRACAYLLQDAYRQAGEIQKAEEIEKHYRLEHLGTYNYYPDTTIPSDLSVYLSENPIASWLLGVLFLFSILFMLLQKVLYEDSATAIDELYINTYTAYTTYVTYDTYNTYVAHDTHVTR